MATDKKAGDKFFLSKEESPAYQNVLTDILNDGINSNKITEEQQTEIIVILNDAKLPKEKRIARERVLGILGYDLKLFEEEVKKEEKRLKKENKRKDQAIYTSSYVNGQMIAEQVFEGNKTEFCVYDVEKDKIDYMEELQRGKTIYRPLYGEEIEKRAILLPSRATEYENDEKLDQEIKDYIREWLDIPEEVMQFALWNIKRSWVYERFHTLNYLRALGDTGTGKSRFLDTLGHIHYKPIATSGATTAAPVFRVINKWRGTLIMDEADLQKSDEAQDIIKIINLGYEKGKHIMRCDQNDANKLNFFDPYCPKILATRKTFIDKAVESRCITQVMQQTNRKDIPYNLNEKFFKKTEELRNKLLMWRFRNYHKISPDFEGEHDFGHLEPRVKQIVSSFIALFSADQKQMKGFKKFITNYQEELIEERQNSFEGQIVGAIHSLFEQGIEDIAAIDIINESQLTNKAGKLISPRGISSTLKSLGFGQSKFKKIDGKSKRCIPINRDRIRVLFGRYGHGTTVDTVVTGISQFYNNYNNVTNIPHNVTNIPQNPQKTLKRGVTPQNRDSVTSVTDFEYAPDIFHAKCTICGDTKEPKICYFKGKPICDNCRLNLEANQ